MSSLLNTTWNFINQNDQGGTGFTVNFLANKAATVTPPFATGCTYTELGNHFVLTAPMADGLQGWVTLFLGAHTDGAGMGKLTHHPQSAGADSTFTMRKTS